MKQFGSYVLAGIIGGLMVFGLISITEKETININTSPKATLTSNNVNTANIGFNFVEASTLATPAVVHIEAKESKELAQSRRGTQRRVDPFGFEDFFGGDMFGQNFFGPKQGAGSGVLISSDGYIVTNNHVVGFADVLKVTLSDGRVFEGKKIGTDPSSDLAVIKVEGNDFPSLSFTDSDKLRVGEWVLAVGNPFSYLKSTVTAGIVSAKGRDLNIIEAEKQIEEFIQTDAAINPGNSGGALVDQLGNLVGINTAIATPNGVFAGYSFAIPSNLAKKIVYDIIENGNIERANLGIRGYDIDKDLVTEKELPVEKGFYVAEVEDGSGAQFSGILPGDVIVGINQKEVLDIDDIKIEMRFSKVGDTINLSVLRDGKKKTIPVKLRKSI